jgi:hypothetical protein
MVDIINQSDIRVFRPTSDTNIEDINDSTTSSNMATVRSCKRLIRKNRAGAAASRLDSWSRGERPASLDDPSVVRRLSNLHPAADDRDVLASC